MKKEYAPLPRHSAKLLSQTRPPLIQSPTVNHTERHTRPLLPERASKRISCSSTDSQFPEIDNLSNPMLSAAATKHYLLSLRSDLLIEFSPRETKLLETIQYHLDAIITAERRHSEEILILNRKVDEVAKVG